MSQRERGRGVGGRWRRGGGRGVGGRGRGRGKGGGRGGGVRWKGQVWHHPRTWKSRVTHVPAASTGAKFPIYRHISFSSFILAFPDFSFFKSNCLVYNITNQVQCGWKTFILTYTNKTRILGIPGARSPPPFDRFHSRRQIPGRIHCSQEYPSVSQLVRQGISLC